ncbi:MAG: hypothetical protein U0930_17110 [Pirellulales bacterium]
MQYSTAAGKIANQPTRQLKFGGSLLTSLPNSRSPMRIATTKMTANGAKMFKNMAGNVPKTKVASMKLFIENCIRLPM